MVIQSPDASKCHFCVRPHLFLFTVSVQATIFYCFGRGTVTAQRWSCEACGKFVRLCNPLLLGAYPWSDKELFAFNLLDIHTGFIAAGCPVSWTGSWGMINRQFGTLKQQFVSKSHCIAVWCQVERFRARARDKELSERCVRCPSDMKELVIAADCTEASVRIQQLLSTVGFTSESAGEQDSAQPRKGWYDMMSAVFS